MTGESKHPDGKISGPGPGLLPGSQHGPCTLLEELGTGSSGSVYRAQLRYPVGELSAGDEVAVKFLRQELAQDPEAQRRLLAEGRLGLKIQSPHVVRIHAVETSVLQGRALTYLVMELIDGHSLRELLQDAGSVVEELARRIGRDAAMGLEALHHMHLVHRDVKPENLALTTAGRVKLMDLGLVRRQGPRRQRQDPGSGFFGSLSYAAPEVLRGQPATPRSDLYSLGVVLYEMATGQHPFASPDQDPDAVIAAHLDQDPPPPSRAKPRISAFLEQLILDLLHKDPRQRPASARELARTLERGENSRYWLRSEQRSPQLASRRRLRAMRRASDTVFVGRRSELRALDAQLRRVLAGDGAAVWISGPRGMGRRRLLDQWLQSWLDRRPELHFLGGEARGGSGILRAAPFAEMLLEYYLRGDRPDSPHAEARLAARISSLTGMDESEASRLSAIAADREEGLSPEERAGLLAAQVLRLRPEGRPMVLRIDLAEQLSTTAQLVVDRLIARLEGSRCLLLLVALDGRHPAAGSTHIPLHGLSEDEFLQLGRSLFAEERVPTELLQGAFRTLAGSPGNLLDTLGHLQATGCLRGQPGSYQLMRPVRELKPPATLLERLQQRLDILSPQQRFIHQAAAVLGNSFPIADLAQLAGQTELAVLEALSVFQGRIVITQRSEGRFRHRDYRKVLLQTLPVEVMRRLHRSAAFVLEERGAPSLEIGMHYSQALEHEAAVPPLLTGLAQLVDSGSRQNSSRVLRRIARHLDRLPPGLLRQQYELQYLALAARTRERLGEAQAAQQAWRQVAETAREVEDPQTLGEALVGIGRAELDAGRITTALVQLDQAEELLAGQPESQGIRSQAHHLHGKILGYIGESEAALRHLRLALDLLPQADAAQLPHLLVDLGRLECLRRHFGVGLRSFGRAAALFRERGSSSGLLRVLLHEGRARSQIGERQAATEVLREARRHAERLGDTRAAAKASLFRGEQYLLWQQNARARRRLEPAFEGGDPLTRARACLHLRDLGASPWSEAELQAAVDEIALPALRVQWLLGEADLHPDPRTARIKEAQQLGRQATLPLALHCRLLRAAGLRSLEQDLIQEVAQRLPQRAGRRAFLQMMKR